jgi:hypothetical protein
MATHQATQHQIAQQIVQQATQIAQQMLLFFFFWWGLLHGPQQGPDRMKEKNL